MNEARERLILTIGLIVMLITGLYGACELKRVLKDKAQQPLSEVSRVKVRL